MSPVLELDKSDITIKNVKIIFDLILSSDSIQDLCRRIVHDDSAGGRILGSYVYSINSSLDFSLEIGYGKASKLVQPLVSSWERDGPLAMCVQKKAPFFELEENIVNVAIPLLKEGIPVACLLLITDPQQPHLQISKSTFEFLSKIGAFFVESRPTRNVQLQKRSGEEKNKSLTARQIHILKLASDGLTNTSIGKVVSLSESTVRQETIRIYKILGANGRSEAVTKAQQSGLL